MNNDLISREALKKHIMDLFEEEEKIDKKWAMGLKYSIKLIDNAPSVPIPTDQNVWESGYECGKNERPHGKWIDINSIVNKARCTNCKNIMITEPFGKTEYCPNCGARMNGGEE